MESGNKIPHTSRPPSREEEQKQERRTLTILLGAVFAGVILIWVLLSLFVY